MSDIMLIKESQRAKVAPSNMEGLIPPDERKEGDANGYIFRAYRVQYVHCYPYWIVLCNLKGKKIAANYSQ